MRWLVAIAGLAMGSLAAPHPARAAEQQIRPFIGLSFSGSTTFVPNLDQAAAKKHFLFGVGAMWLGDMVGVDVDVAHVPRFFQAAPQQNLVINSSATTLTGNIVVAAPRKLTEYSLRPYVVAGGGLMRATNDDNLGVLVISETLPTWDVGGGVIGFVTDRVGVSWDVRRFSGIRKDQNRGLSIGAERVSFWRASMALAYRY